MKKVALILILGVFIFQMLGVFLLFKVKQTQIRQEMKMQIKAGVPKSKLTVLTFDNDALKELKWIKDHEFVYKGQMYDVVETSETSDGIIYYCLADHQETKLFADLNNLVGNELAKDKTHSANKTNVFVNWYCTDILNSNPDAAHLIVKIFTEYQFTSLLWDSIPESPPPRFLA